MTLEPKHFPPYLLLVGAVGAGIVTAIVFIVGGIAQEGSRYPVWWGWLAIIPPILAFVGLIASAIALGGWAIARSLRRGLVGQLVGVVVGGGVGGALGQLIIDGSPRFGIDHVVWPALVAGLGLGAATVVWMRVQAVRARRRDSTPNPTESAA